MKRGWLIAVGLVLGVALGVALLAIPISPQTISIKVDLPPATDSASAAQVTSGLVTVMKAAGVWLVLSVAVCIAAIAVFVGRKLLRPRQHP